MRLIDFHTHHENLSDELAIQQDIHTWGIHPWQAANVNCLEVPNGEWLALGECGLDRLCQTPWENQMEMFRKQILLSEQLRLPLILHCVKAHPEALALQKELHATMPWICHGFRGKPSQMQQLVANGWYLSFGHHFNLETVRQCPIQNLLIETDDSPIDVRDVYERIACLRDTTTDELATQMWKNFEKLFGKSPIQALSAKKNAQSPLIAEN